MKGTETRRRKREKREERKLELAKDVEKELSRRTGEESEKKKSTGIRTSPQRKQNKADLPNLERKEIKENTKKTK